MSNAPRPNDPRIPETLKHIRQLAKRQSRRVAVKDYLEYRESHARHLPSMNTLFRLFGSWKSALAEAGVDQSSSKDLSRTPDDLLIAALKEAAKDRGIKVLSSHIYDDWRRQKIASKKGPWRKSMENPPSSSVIRKWLGPWGAAVQRAGLETTERSTPRRATKLEIIAALRSAKENVSGMLTPRSYNEYRSQLADSERGAFPDLAQIIGSQFPSWEDALRAADVEQSDAVHPTALWTAEEVRRIVRKIEFITKRPISKKDYEQVRRESSKMMPTWQVVSDLLKL